jgi:3-deoxy-7-phosphoheptulonate synthase
MSEDKVEDRNLRDITPLVPPRAVKARLPLTERAERLVLATRAAIRDILHGRDTHRLLAVVGPCSIHDPAAALDYAHRLKAVAERVSDHLLVVMRTYFEKPRTTIGWKGLTNDPKLDGSCDIPAGLQLARSILLDINHLGLPCASELLDPITPQYFGDLVSWAAIGARTSQSQTHREMASGLSMPIGFKNATDGSLEGAVNAMISAGHPHGFVGITADGVSAVIRTAGNPDRHIVLRGGGGRPNYAPENVARAAEMVAPLGVVRPVMIDCSHDNSNKDHTRQAAVLRSTIEQASAGRVEIMGFMLESNLHPGKQAWQPHADLAYGVSITDACLGWEETVAVLESAAGALAAKAERRSAANG